MDTLRALTLVEQLEDNIEDLEEALQPVLTQALSETTKKLPLLDRAKLHVTIVYALGSLLFSYLKLHGVDAKSHKVFIELTRVKQYFEKIKVAEGEPESTSLASTSQIQVGPNLRLDKPAAARIFKHDLAETDKEILARAEAEARQKFLANRKLKALEASMKAKVAAKDTTMTDVDAQIEPPITELLMEETQAEPSPSDQLVASLVAAAEAGDITFPNTPKTPTPAINATSPKSKRKEKKRKRAEQESADLEDGEVDETKADNSKKKSKKQRKREAKEAKTAAKAQAFVDNNR